MPRRPPSRKDDNHASIVRTLESVPACSVQSLASMRFGVPDLLVGFRKKNFLLEIKTERTDLNDNEREWHAAWRGDVRVVRSSLEAMLAIGLTYREASKIFKRLRGDPKQPALPGAEEVRKTENRQPALLEDSDVRAGEAGV